MQHVQGDNYAQIETISNAHLVSTSVLSKDCTHHLSTTEQLERELHEQLERELHDQQNAAAMSTPENGLSISETPVHGTEISSYSENSEIIDSYCSPGDFTNSYSSMAWRQNVNNDSILTPNKTLTATPELPVCDSSDTLDIPFASMFDLMDFQDSGVKTSAMKVFRENIQSSETMSPKLSGRPDLPRMRDLHNSMKLMSTDSPLRYSSLELTVPLDTHEKSSNCGAEEVPLPLGVLDGPTAVRSPYKSLTSFNDVLDNGDENNNSHSRTTDVDFELESETGVDTFDGSLQENAEDDSRYQSEGSSIFRTDTELSTLPPLSDGTSKIMSSLLATSTSTKQLGFLCSTYRDASQQADDSEHNRQYKTATNDNFLNTERYTDIASDGVSWSEIEVSDKSQHIAVNQSVSQTGISVSSRDESWSYYTLPGTKQNTPTGHRKRDSVDDDNYITVRPKLPPRAPMELKNAETGSAAKRRKGNAASAATVTTSSHQGRSVRQRLPFNSPLRPTCVDHHHHATDSDVSELAAHTALSARTVPYMVSDAKYEPGVPSSSHNHCSLEARLSQRKPQADQGFQRKPQADQDFQRKLLADQDFQRKPQADQDFQRKLQADQDFQRKSQVDQDFKRKLLADQDFKKKLLADQDFQRILLADQNFQRKLLADQDFQRKLLAGKDFHRKPLAGLSMNRHGNCNVPAESSSYLSTSPNMDSDIDETSPDTFLPSHQDYKLHKRTTSRYLNETRQHNKSNEILRKVSNPYKDHEQKASKPHKNHAGMYILRDPATNEIIERKVEGAENVPPSLVFPTKRQNGKVFKTVAHSQKQHFSHNSLNKKVNKKTSGRIGMSKQKLERLSNLRKHSKNSNEYSREASSGYHGSHCTTESGRSKESTKSHRTHPIACSTLILNNSSSCADSDAVNISTWTLDDNFQKSNFCSTLLNDKHTINHANKLHAVPVYMETDTSRSLTEYQSNGRGFEISSIVSQIGNKLSHSRFNPNTEMGKNRKNQTTRTSNRCKLSTVAKDASADYNFSTTQSLSQTMSTSNSETIQSMDTHERESSASASDQTTTSSMFSNQATASMSCPPSEQTTTPEPCQWSSECKNSGYTSAEGSEMHYQKYSDSDDLPTTSTSEDQTNLYQKYNISDDSLCPAARCRPRYSNQQPKNMMSSKCNSQSIQSILNSILTDSPKSVDPSGILAPDNSTSYNQCPDFYDFYSNNIINPFANIQNMWPSCRMIKPKTSGPAADDMSSSGENNSDSAAECQTKATRNIGVCYNPQTSVTDAKFVMTQESLANPQSHPTSSAVSSSCRIMTQESLASYPTSSAASISRRSPSTSKDHLDKSLFVMSPCAVTDPSTVKSKHSLGHKLRKFRNNVYKKTKKLTHLHICE